MGQITSEDIVLILPPTVIPDTVQSGIPHLVGSLRSAGIEPKVINLGMDYLNELMKNERMEALLKEARQRQSFLLKQDKLSTADGIELWELLRHSSLQYLATDIEDHIAVFSDAERFYDFESYFQAARAGHDAMGLLSSTMFPFAISYSHMKSHLHDFETSSDELWKAVDAFEELEGHLGFDLLRDLLHRSLPEKAPAMVGVSVGFTSQFVPSFWIAREIRRKFPETKVVFGGATVAKQAYENHKHGKWPFCKEVDAICIGDGEAVIVDLARKVIAGEPLSGGPSILVHDPAAGTGELEGIALIHELNELPIADYRLAEMEKYWIPEPAIAMTVSRGCYWDKCTFCYYGLVTEEGRVTPPYRELTAENIVNRMKHQSELHGIRLFNFTTDSASPAFLNKLALKAIEEGTNHLRWTVMARAEKTFNVKRAQTLADGGLLYMYYGLESMDDEVLKAIDKGTSADQYHRVLSAFYQAGVATGCLGFFGFPTEGTQAAWKSLNFLSDNRNILSELQWGYFGLEKGAIAYQNPSDYGLKKLLTNPRFDLSDFVEYETEKEMKTPSEMREIQSAFREVYDSYHYNFERPFLVGARCVHSALYYDKYGNDAIKDFTEFSWRRPKQIEADLCANPGLELKAMIDFEHLSRVKLESFLEQKENALRWVRDEQSKQLVEIEQEGSTDSHSDSGLVSLNKRAERQGEVEIPQKTKSEIFEESHFEFEVEELTGDNQKTLVGSPWGVKELNEDAMELLSIFAEPISVEEISEEMEVEVEVLAGILAKWISYGWIGIVDQQKAKEAEMVEAFIAQKTEAPPQSWDS